MPGNKNVLVRFSPPTSSESRLGLISLGTLDAEFLGMTGSWSMISRALAAGKMIPETLLDRIRFLELFGEYIANSDMHSYNLSFITRGLHVIDLAPAYGMTCMLFMPKHYQIIPIEFNPPLPMVGDKHIWGQVYNAAIDFWDEVISDVRISPSFKKIAAECKQKLAALPALVALLPK